MTFGLELLDLCSCQLFCLSGLTRKNRMASHKPPPAPDRSGLPVVTDTIWMGDMARSGVTDPQDSEARVLRIGCYGERWHGAIGRAWAAWTLRRRRRTLGACWKVRLVSSGGSWCAVLEGRRLSGWPLCLYRTGRSLWWDLWSRELPCCAHGQGSLWYEAVVQDYVQGTRLPVEQDYRSVSLTSFHLLDADFSRLKKRASDSSHVVVEIVNEWWTAFREVDLIVINLVLWIALHV